MKDLDSKELKVGDRVAVSVGGRYHDFYIAVVTRMTAKMVEVEAVHLSRSWNKGKRLIHPHSCVILS